MSYPQAPVPAPAAGAPVAAPVQDQTQAPPPDQAAPPPEDQQDQGQSATDAAGDDPMTWLMAAEADARFETVDRPMLQSGQVG